MDPDSATASPTSASPTPQSTRRSTDSFQLAGVTWSGNGRAWASLRVQTDGEWTDWTQLSPLDAAAERGSADAKQADRGATEPLWVRHADGVQLRLDHIEGGDIADLAVELIDPGESAADEVLPPNARGPARADRARVIAAQATQPGIISRAQWGADESIRLAQCPGGPSYTSTISAGFVHHTAGSNSYASVAEAMQAVRGVYAYHVQSRGYCDIGYNFLVDKWGNLYEGRAGGIDRAVLGAHTGGFNTNTFAVSLLGRHGSVAPPTASVDAIARLMVWKLSLYGRNPQGTTTLTSSGGGTSKYPAGTSVTFNVISGHRDAGNTDCPGDLAYNQLSAIRTKAVGGVGGPSLVEALYHDFLGRGADAAGEQFWTTVFAATGSRGAVADGLAFSPESTGRVVDGLYQRYLGRGTDPAGRDYWSGQLARRQTSPGAVAALQLASGETFAQAGGSVDAWVAEVYRRALRREPDPSGRAFWVAETARVGRQRVANALVGSGEARLTRVVESYGRVLQREADPGGAGFAVNYLGGNSELSLEAMLASSHEYFGRAQQRFPA